MKVEILHGPGNPLVKLGLGSGQSCVAEGGSMIAMDGHIKIHTTTHQRGGGGVFSGVRRKLSGETFFLNHFSAGSVGGHVWLAPATSGDLVEIPLYGRGLVVQSGSYLCCEERVHIEMGWQGFKSLLSGEKFFWLKASGEGVIVLSAFGAIYTVDVFDEYIVDTGHIVAFEETLDFSITKAGTSWLASFLGGEGLVCKFKGRGRLWCQSHNPISFGRVLGPLLPPIVEEL
jgi:uncharacterized protein (TIGR00266 family)